MNPTLLLILAGTDPGNVCCPGVLLIVTLLLPKYLCSDYRWSYQKPLTELQSMADQLLCARPYILKSSKPIIAFSLFINSANI